MASATPRAAPAHPSAHPSAGQPGRQPARRDLPRAHPADRPIVVASVPADHVYVRHLSPPAGPAGSGSPAGAGGSAGPGGSAGSGGSTDNAVGDPDAARGGVVRLPDPHPDGPVRGPDRAVNGGRWWPPLMLEPDWVSSHDPDVLHVHFGYDDRTPAQLAALVRTLAERDVPLVLTLHDLRNPHHADDAALPRQLDVLVPAAAAVLTLTDSAAAEISRRWGVAAEVLPHPHVVEPADILRLRRRAVSGRRRVGVSAKSLRTNTDPLRLLPGLLAAARAGADVVVDLHHDVHDEPPTPYAAELRQALDAASASGAIQVWVHDRLDDEELWAHLAGLDAVVLPYRFGTHSGWLEAAHDLGVRVVAPSHGHYAGQGADHLYAADETSVDPASLCAAVLAAVADPTPPMPAEAYVEARRRQRLALAEAHERVYRTVLDRSFLTRTVVEVGA